MGKYETYPYLLEPVRRGSYTWYFIQLKNGIKGYIRGDCVKVTSAPKNVVTATPAGGSVTPAPASTVAPTAVPAGSPDNPTGYVKTSMDYVNVRKGIWGDVIYVVKNKGTVFPYIGTPTVKNNITWYYIYSSNFPGDGYAYIHGNFVRECGKDGGSVAPVTTPTPAPAVTPVTPNPENPDTGDVTEASYTTLKNGSTGQAVANLVNELINQGYYKYGATSKYNSSVENAVRAFQKAKGLAVDGIAGSQTQHALFNTVPVGTANRTNLSMTFYPAEKIDWNTGGIQQLWARGDNVKVYDVYTGKVWWAHRWAGGFHVDAEPLSAADTAVICEMYGVKSADQIKENTHWQRRPCLITIGTRTFACSLYGVPHNYPEGDTISDNDFKGQLCIHFTNSKTHSGKTVDSLHAEAIDYAWKNAPNGHK